MNAYVKPSQDHPSEATLTAFGAALDQLKSTVQADLGERDSNYIYQIIRYQKYSEIVGRTLIHFSLTPISWTAGVSLLSVSKILENMEIGHNVMHGQYDWMNDPDLQSQNYDWDNVCDAESWRKTHNYEHHTYTNILGKDRDYGYALLRLSDDQPWRPKHLFQGINYVALSVLFEYGVALHELELEKQTLKTVVANKGAFLKRFFKKAGKQITKDYILFPALAGPLAPKVMLGNGAANLARNLWASTIIFCGHFTEDAQTFPQGTEVDESSGHWYYRQIRGSSNFQGGRWLHLLSGHLSYQIEHHLFPDIPAHRYPEMAQQVQQICRDHNIPYNTDSFGRQFRSVLKRIARHSLPNKVAMAA